MPSIHQESHHVDQQRHAGGKMVTAGLATDVILRMVSKSSAEYQAEVGAELPADEVEGVVPLLDVHHMQS